MARQVNSLVPEDGFKSKKDFLDQGKIADLDLSIVNNIDPTKKASFDCSGLATGVTHTIASGVPGILQYAAPANAATVTIAAGSCSLALEPAGTIAGATVVLPTVPLDGTIVRISTTATITTLTLSAGGSDTIVNAVATLVANTFAAYVYRASTTKWYRIG